MSKNNHMLEACHVINDLISKEREPRKYDEDFNPMDASGGNFDDAYYMGITQGRAELAEEIREIFKKVVASQAKS